MIEAAMEVKALRDMKDNVKNSTSGGKLIDISANIKFIDNDGNLSFGNERRVRKDNAFRNSYAATLFKRNKYGKGRNHGSRVFRIVAIIAIIMTLPILVLEILYLNGFLPKHSAEEVAALATDSIIVLDENNRAGNEAENENDEDDTNAVGEADGEENVDGEVIENRHEENNAVAYTSQPITVITTVKSSERPGVVPNELKDYASGLEFVHKHYKVKSGGIPLEVKSKPARVSSKVGSVPDSTNVFVKYIYGNWAYVDYNGVKGWTSLDYLML